MSLRCAARLAAASILIGSAWAGDPEADWQAVRALDAGPANRPRTQTEARSIALDHLQRQETALRSFLAAHPTDARVFEAQLRLARLLQMRGGFDRSEKALNESRAIMAGLEKTATPEQRVELDFAAVTRLMRTIGQPSSTRRNELLSAARKFRAAHPGDRRIAALFAEVAALFDNEPKVKVALLTEADMLAVEPDLKGRIADDLRRVALLGQTVPLQFSSIQGQEVKLSDYRGKPVLVVFFADFSPPATDALKRLKPALATLPKGSVETIGICLDPQRATAEATLKEHGLAWPVACDERGWEGELVRSLGINALPTVWLFDKEGRLRSLDALEATSDQIRRLLKE
jgi:peroxiredoxin